MNITDAKPFLPVSDVESVSITFNEVSVHKSGGGWTTLATATQPYTIDLYQFSNGAKTQFVPAVQLESGKYTQVRIGVTSGAIKIKGVPQPVNLEIPSENLKTDKNFEFNVQGGGAVDLTVDFDLSKSIVATGTGTYQLKPVLHLVTTTEAWTIKGKIDSSFFGDPPEKAVVVVTWDKDDSKTISDGDEVYTTLSVTKAEGNPPNSPPSVTEFSVFWLVPNESYYVQVYLGDPENGGVLKYAEAIKWDPNDPNEPAWKDNSKIFLLNGGVALF